ncbi:GNAT family N-acetyltransferase [Paenibacillus mesophilus]|uniref:GNAT family N-acetyltransferase n=1 Tax=Paenibacillus mesophilus TaxID=2582849 RepID=UPI003B75BF5C
MKRLAVDPHYQGRAIGRGLVEHLKSRLERNTLISLSAPESRGYYQSIGFTNFEHIEDTWNLYMK